MRYFAKIIILSFFTMCFISCGYNYEGGDIMIKRETKTIEKTFALIQRSSISLITDFGNVSVRGWNGEKVKVKLILKGKEENISKFHFTYDNVQDILTLKGSYEREGKPADPQLDVYFLVEIPKTESYIVSITSGTGNVDVDNVRATDLQAKTGAGNVSIENPSAPINASTGAGNIIAHISKNQQGMDLSTGAGNIRIKIPTSLFADIDASTHVGGVAFVPIDSIKKISFKSQIEEIRHLEGKINGGGPLVKAWNGAGDIYFEIE